MPSNKTNENEENSSIQETDKMSAPDQPKRKCHVKYLVKYLKIITVEPLVALYQMSITLSKPALDNLEFEKACRVNLNFNDTICGAVLKGKYENYTLQNNEIQAVISNMHSWQQPVQSIMPLVLAFFLGSFSDHYKLRKPFLLLPLLGQVSGYFGCILCVMYMNIWPLEIQGVSQKIIPSLFGGQTMLVMATTAYIADISTKEMRTLRLGIVQIVIGVISPLTNSFAGVLFLKIGYLGILSLSTILLSTALLYGYLYIKEDSLKRVKEDKQCLRNLFNIKHVYDTFMILFKKIPGTSRKFIIIMIAVTFIYRSAFDGESSLLYLYTQNVFQWTPVEYSYFLTVIGLVLLVGNIVSLPLFTRIFQMSDLLILFVTIITKIVTNFIFGLARTPAVFYVGVLTSLVTRMYRVAKKSISTKIVSEKDIGKSQSLWAVFEATAPAISVPVYNFIYLKTLIIYPSAFLFFSIILYGICSILILWMYSRQQRTVKATNEAQNIAQVSETIHM